MQATIHHWVQRYALKRAGAERLWQLSSLNNQPSGLEKYLERGLALLAALLLGAGLVFWVAANWEVQTRAFKFALLEGALLLSLLTALPWPRIRTAALLLATLVLGGLLAFVGQTFQTGADAWQLFAVWAALALVWTLVARSDGLWALWLLIAGLGIALWSGDSLLNPVASALNWRSSRNLLTALLWLGIFVVPLVLPWLGVPRPARIASRVAAAMALSAWVALGIWGLFTREQSGLYLLPMLLVAGAFAVMLLRKPRDFLVLAMAVLALNVLVITGIAHALLSNGDFQEGSILLIAVVAAASMGLSGTWLFRLQRSEDAQ